MIQICLLSFISDFGIRISNFFNEGGLLDLMSMSRARVRHILAPRARHSLQARGGAPGFVESETASAESGDSLRRAVGSSFAPCPSRSVKSSFTSSLARRIASLGSIATCSRACALIRRQSAVTLVLNLCASAVLLITFTSSRRCREHFPKPS